MMTKRWTVGLAVTLATLWIVSIVFISGTAWFCSAAELAYKDPYPTETEVSPGFGVYGQVTYRDGYEPKTVNGGMDAWEFYQAMSENYRNTDHMAQLSTTISDIHITLSTPALMILKKGTNLDVVQVSSLITANDSQGNNYYQAISQMETLGEELKALDKITPSFGMWEKRKYVAEEKTTYVQKGRMGSRYYDDKLIGGIGCTWVKGVEEIHEDTDGFDSSVFDLTKRVTESIETDTYKVEVAPEPYDIESNYDEEGCRVIKLNFKTASGKWSYDIWYMWDDLDGTTAGKYVYFVGDRNNKAWPARGDGLSNYIVNESTIDIANSSIEESTVDGHKLYTLNLVLQESEQYSWDLITSGEKKYLQDGTKGFVDFAMEYSTVQRDTILRYEVWENGSIRRIIRQNSMNLGGADGDEKGPDKTSVLGGQGYGYGSVTNTQYQEFVYDGPAVDFMNNDAYSLGGGALPIPVILGIVGGIVAAGVIVAVVIVKVRKKKKLALATEQSDSDETQAE